MKNNFTSPSSFKYLNISILKEHLPSFGMVQMNFSSFSEFLFDRYTRVQCPKVEKQIIIVLHFDEFLSRCNLDHPVNHGISNINACFCKYNLYLQYRICALFYFSQVFCQFEDKTSSNFAHFRQGFVANFNLNTSTLLHDFKAFAFIFKLFELFCLQFFSNLLNIKEHIVPVIPILTIFGLQILDLNKVSLLQILIYLCYYTQNHTRKN